VDAFIGDLETPTQTPDSAAGQVDSILSWRCSGDAPGE